MMTAHLAGSVDFFTGFDLLVNVFRESPDFPLFYRPEFFRLHVADTQRAFFFQIHDRVRNRIVGAVPFVEREAGRAHSPPRGSFGGFYAVVEQEQVPFLDALVARVEQVLAEGGIREVSLILPPQDYYPALVAILIEILFRRGYHPTRADLNHARAVLPGPNAFLDAVQHGNRNDIRRCERRGFTFHRLGADQLANAYEVLRDHYARRGHPLSMTYDAIDDMRRRIPGSVEAFGVFADNRLIAASICVLVDRHNFYVFYWGERSGCPKPSSVPFLAKGMYEACQQGGFRLMDAGMSMVDGHPSLGLVRFKRSLGFRESLKFSFRKVLD